MELSLNENKPKNACRFFIYISLEISRDFPRIALKEHYSEFLINYSYVLRNYKCKYNGLRGRMIF